MIPNNACLVLSASCKAVKGAARTLLMDYGRKKFYFIENTYHNILMQLNRSLIATVLEQHTENNKVQITEFINYLAEEELAFLTDDLSLFPEHPEEWHDTPAVISNAIFEIGDNKTDYTVLLEQLDALCCRELQLRYIVKPDFEEMYALCEAVLKTDITYLELYLPFDEMYTLEQLCSLLENNCIICHIYLYDAPVNKTHRHTLQKEGYFPVHLGNVYFLKQPINCGIINYFTLFNTLDSQENYFELKDHNGCLNKKIAVDANGEIKNCPSMAKSFGNINNTTLASVVQLDDFKKAWHINKDKIDKCKVCEFRLCCTDCRAFTEDPSNEYAKPLKCSYDPYTATWE